MSDKLIKLLLQSQSPSNNSQKELWEEINEPWRIGLIKIRDKGFDLTEFKKPWLFHWPWWSSPKGDLLLCQEWFSMVLEPILEETVKAVTSKNELYYLMIASVGKTGEDPKSKFSYLKKSFSQRGKIRKDKKLITFDCDCPEDASLVLNNPWLKNV